MKPEVGHNHETHPPSEDMPKSTRLFKRKGIWYYRQRIPLDLVKAGVYGKRKDFKKSLKTADKATAQRLADTLAIQKANEWDAKRLELNSRLAERDGIKAPCKRPLSSLSNIEQEDLIIRLFVEMEKRSEESGNRDGSYAGEDPREAIENVGTDYARASGAHPEDGWEYSTRSFLEDHGIEIDDPAALKHLTRLYNRAYTENTRRTYSALTSDHCNGGDIFFRKYDARSRSTNQSKEIARNKTIKELCDRYRDAKTAEDIVPSTRQKHELQFRIIIDFFGPNKIIDTIRPDDARNLAAFLRKIPSNWTKRYPKKKLTEAVKLENKRNRPATLSPKTQRDYYDGITSIFSYAVDLEYIDSNPFRNKTVSKALPKIPKPKKLMLTMNEMNQIFSSPEFLAEHENPNQSDRAHARFWIPILCLFHGFRSNESAQLLTEDIKEEKGIRYFDIRETNNAGLKTKRLKTSSSERKIPIHNELIKMGFLEYVQELKLKGAINLFPALKENKRGSKSDLVGKWFSNLRKKLLPSENFGKGDKTLHSMRHSMNDVLRNAGVSEELRKAVGGWKKSGSSSEADYGQGFGLEKLKEVVDKIQYPEVDFSHFYTS